MRVAHGSVTLAAAAALSLSLCSPGSGGAGAGRDSGAPGAAHLQAVRFRGTGG